MTVDTPHLQKDQQSKPSFKIQIYSSQHQQLSQSKQHHESSFCRGKSQFKSKPLNAPKGPGKTLGTTLGAICSICGFDGHTADQCGRVKAVRAKLQAAREKGLTRHSK
jgi:hypothetical protein